MSDLLKSTLKSIFPRSITSPHSKGFAGPTFTQEDRLLRSSSAESSSSENCPIDENKENIPNAGNAQKKESIVAKAKRLRKEREAEGKKAKTVSDLELRQNRKKSSSRKLNFDAAVDDSKARTQIERQPRIQQTQRDYELKLKERRESLGLDSQPPSPWLKILTEDSVSTQFTEDDCVSDWTDSEVSDVEDTHRRFSKSPSSHSPIVKRRIKFEVEEKQNNEVEFKYDIPEKLPQGGSVKSLLKWILVRNEDARKMEWFWHGYKAVKITPDFVFESLVDLYEELCSSSVVSPNKRLCNERKSVRFLYSFLKSCTPTELYEGEPPTLSMRVMEFLDRIEKHGFKQDSLTLHALLIVQKTKAQASGLRTSGSPTKDRLQKLAACKQLTKTPNPRPYKFHFLSLSNSKIAENLHCIEFNLFKKINMIEECVNSVWMKEDRADRAPNVVKIIAHFNTVSYWVATEILTGGTPPQQAAIIKKFVALAQECRGRNNFNSLFEILAGLGLGSVAQLTEAWKLVPHKVRVALSDMEGFISSIDNYKMYRKELALVSHLRTVSRIQYPILPFLGVFLRDMAFIDAGNLTQIEGVGLNYQKVHLMGTELAKMAHLQSQKNDMNEDPIVYNYLSNLNVMDEDTLFNYSDLLVKRNTV